MDKNLVPEKNQVYFIRFFYIFQGLKTNQSFVVTPMKISYRSLRNSLQCSKRNRITRKLVGVMQKHRLLEQALPSLFPFSLPPPPPLFCACHAGQFFRTPKGNFLWCCWQMTNYIFSPSLNFIRLLRVVFSSE